ncbi:MAG: AbrB/MazE/SpoVT family DNA-binding domain-containing protein [Melioribacteraceae bacterium]|jgi:AbrB family looped-hinge helix DNA binding protein|nr:AbrB/MazE/SpoVT family DNA-binding domain-containing protein [Melioribacteraceae bacterium]
MTTVKISPKYQVVIPKEIRNKLKLKPGQRMQIFQFGERIEFIPLKNIKESRGFLKGMDTNLSREEDRL